MTEFTTPDGHCVERRPHPDGPRYGELIKVTRGDNSVNSNVETTYTEYVDDDGVRHGWDHAGDHSFDAVPNWFHPDPRRPVCRDRTCPGNRLAQRTTPPLVTVVGGTEARHHEELHYRVANVGDRLVVYGRLLELVRDLDWELRYEAIDRPNPAEESR